MSIRDIIEWLAEEMDGCDKDYGRGCALQFDIARISAVVALMEAVCEAAEEWVRECHGAEYQDDGCTADSWGECERPCAARVHLTSLQAYRKEHGL